MATKYHPDFFNKLDRKSRELHYARLRLIQDNISQRGSILDVGCANGFFCFAFNKTHSPIVGIDNNEERARSCNITARRNGIRRIKFLYEDVLDKRILIHWDTIFYLSIHQHVIVKNGWEKAGELFRRLSENCSEMFFDMGQKDELNLKLNDWWQFFPETENVEEWTRDYIKKNSVFKSIKIIGKVNRLLWHLKQ